VLQLSEYRVERVGKREVSGLLEEFHYLSGISRGFKSKVNYALVSPDKKVMGACIFTGFPVPELAVGLFGLSREDQEGLFELSRLCLHPDLQKEKNAASWFVSRAVRFLRRDYQVRAILSYADSEFHRGTVYRALGFQYFGLSAPKKDFFVRGLDGEYSKKQSRGGTTGKDGVWKARSRKHRFLLIYDKKLIPKWMKPEYQ